MRTGFIFYTLITKISSTWLRCSGRPTYVGVLLKDERWHEVSPHGRWLEDKKEDAEVLVDDVGSFLAFLGSLQVPGDGQVGALSRPQGRATQTQDHGGRDEGVPERVERGLILQRFSWHFYSIINKKNSSNMWLVVLMVEVVQEVTGNN